MPGPPCGEALALSVLLISVDGDVPETSSEDPVVLELGFERVGSLATLAACLAGLVFRAEGPDAAIGRSQGAKPGPRQQSCAGSVWKPTAAPPPGELRQHTIYPKSGHVFFVLLEK